MWQCTSNLSPNQHRAKYQVVKMKKFQYMVIGEACLGQLSTVLLLAGTNIIIVCKQL